MQGVAPSRGACVVTRDIPSCQRGASGAHTHAHGAAYRWTTLTTPLHRRWGVFAGIPWRASAIQWSAPGREFGVGRCCYEWSRHFGPRSSAATTVPHCRRLRTHVHLTWPPRCYTLLTARTVVAAAPHERSQQHGGHALRLHPRELQNREAHPCKVPQELQAGGHASGAGRQGQRQQQRESRPFGYVCGLMLGITRY